MALVRSLRARVVLWVSVALVVLFAATGVVLDVAFRNSMDQARHELLDVQVLGLMALVDDESHADPEHDARTKGADERHGSSAASVGVGSAALGGQAIAAPAQGLDRLV